MCLFLICIILSFSKEVRGIIFLVMRPLAHNPSKKLIIISKLQMSYYKITLCQFLKLCVNTKTYPTHNNNLYGQEGEGHAESNQIIIIIIFNKSLRRCNSIV